MAPGSSDWRGVPLPEEPGPPAWPGFSRLRRNSCYSAARPVLVPGCDPEVEHRNWVGGTCQSRLAELWCWQAANLKASDRGQRSGSCEIYRARLRLEEGRSTRTRGQSKEESLFSLTSRRRHGTVGESFFRAQDLST